MKFNFDKKVDRKNTNSFKWDMGEEYFGCNDVIPVWVADMDFECAPSITEALIKRAKHPIYGYEARKDDYYLAVINWLKRRHNCEVTKDELSFSPPGVIYAIKVMFDLLTECGDKVIIPMPNYDPLFELISKSGRKIIASPLAKKGKEFKLDIDGFCGLVKKEKPKVLIMSSPHNPTGRVWTKSELLAISNVCNENNTFMIIDEIHADFVPKTRKHIAFTTLGKETAKNSMVCYSCNKGFNLGGLQMASLIISDKNKKALFDEQMLIAQTRLDNTFGAVALKEAYTNTECEKWLDQAIEYVECNKKFVADFMEEKCPRIKVIKSESTYLMWLDCELLGLKGKELEAFMINKAHVAYCAGYEFGKQGENYLRLNVACPRHTLERVLNQTLNAVNKYL